MPHPRLNMPQDEAATRLQARIALGREIQSQQIVDSDGLKKARRDFRSWDEYNESLIEAIVDDPEIVASYNYTGPMISFGDLPWAKELQYFRDDVDTKVRRLESLQSRLELFGDASGSSPSKGPVETQRDIAESLLDTLDRIREGQFRDQALIQEAKNQHALLSTTYQAIYGGVPILDTSYPTWVWWKRAREAASQALAFAGVTVAGEDDPTPALHLATKKVFVVHGREHGLKEAVVSLLQRLGLEPVVLHLKPDMGSTVIEKIEREGQDAAFAVVLLTPDDEGRLRSTGKPEEPLRPRARQNVVLEYGYFLGLLGRDSVVALASQAGDFEPPTDVSGVLYVPVASVEDEAWRFRLASEMKSAGLEVDLNDLSAQ
jgi:predicted nucleotide-binding protein